MEIVQIIMLFIVIIIIFFLIVIIINKIDCLRIQIQFFNTSIIILHYKV